MKKLITLAVIAAATFGGIAHAQQAPKLPACQEAADSFVKVGIKAVMDTDTSLTRGFKLDVMDAVAEQGDLYTIYYRNTCNVAAAMLKQTPGAKTEGVINQLINHGFSKTDAKGVSAAEYAEAMFQTMGLYEGKFIVTGKVE